MRRLSFVALVIGFLAACKSKPASPVGEPSRSKPQASSPGSDKPDMESSGVQFSGAVGELDDGAKFIAFITNHENQIVTLDVRFAAEDFDGGQNVDADFFVVWDDCDKLPEGQKPNNSFCTGFEYHIPKGSGQESGLVKESSGWRLRGRFKVVNAGGPLQGLMAVRLEPVAK